LKRTAAKLSEDFLQPLVQARTQSEGFYLRI
jgi:hypothetical protein